MPPLDSPLNRCQFLAGDDFHGEKGLEESGLSPC